MTKSCKTVVPFERPAAYWATRARRHYTPARLPDAARLMRKALEESGDPGMALELARIYAGMECHTAAERCLVRAVTRGGLTSDVCFAIGCCALNRSDEALAEQALEACLRMDPQGAFADQAQDLLDLHAWPQGEALCRGARGETLCLRAQRALMAGDTAGALLLARRAWEKSRSYQAAMLLGGLSAPPQAVFFFTHAARCMPGAQPPRLLLAQICFHAGRPADGLRYLALARLLCTTITQAEAFCVTAWEVGQPEQALSLAAEHLEKNPASVDYLRLKYLTLKRLGDEEGARRALQTLLDIDPDDASGLWYRRHPEDTRLYAGRKIMLSALACQISALPGRLTPGPLNRALHLMVMLLADSVEAAAIYQFLPPLWRRLTPAEKRACDDRRGIHYPFAFALYLLLCTGQPARAAELFAALPGKKRALRALKHFARLMNEE